MSEAKMAEEDICRINQVLPIEILRKVLQYLDFKSLCSAKQVCKQWKEAIDWFALLKEATRKFIDLYLMIDVFFKML